jgi:Delta7-sterol 5-desaturase
MVYIIVPTPFASHAFHPLDGYLQSIPYHLYIFLFPLHQKLYLALFGFVNFWTIFVSNNELLRSGQYIDETLDSRFRHGYWPPTRNNH